MNRKLTALGLTLLAVVATGAIVASGVSAWFESDTNKTTLTAKALTVQIFETSEMVFTCEEIILDETTVGKLEPEITAKPTYDKCNFGGLPVKVDMNGCHFLMTTKSKMHIRCPGTNKIQITVSVLGTYMPCIDIPAQTPSSPVIDYINKGTEDKMHVEITATVEGVEYEKTGFCGSGVFKDGAHTGWSTITGEDATGKFVNFTYNG